MNMDNRYPYPPSEGLQPPGVSNNYAQSSYNASRPPHNMMSANAANASTPGNHASTWNTSQMFFPPPTLPRPERFQSPPMPQLHRFSQSEPPPPIPGFAPPPGLSTPPGLHPPSGPGLPPPHALHPPSGPGLPPPTGLHSFTGPGLTPPSRHPPPPGLHSSPGPGLAPPAHLLPPARLHPPPGFSPIPSPGPPPPPFTRQNHGSGYGVQMSTQKQVHPEFSGSVANFFQEKERFVEPAIKPQPEDEMTIQRREDEKWLKQFLESKEKLIRSEPKPQPNVISVSDMRNALHSTAQLVSQLSSLCEDLKLNIDNQKAWSDSFAKALNMKEDIQGRLKVLSDHKHLERMRMKLSSIVKRRDRRRRARQRLQMEEQEREVQKADKDVAIERWRMKQIHAEEEKKKEQELKVAADAVLCEVRKKLTDVKRMQNILKSLEKLRKLRKEAASRKGIFTDPQSEETFSNLLEELRSVAKKRTAVYSAEEKALMVMVEGEQEEERRRDLERRRQKERDKQLQKKRKVDAMLFGDDTPADPLMQPFRQYYTQAEHSLPALVQIRREWDIFLVPVDHPEGSAVPQGWVIPDAPSDQAWASALQTSEGEDV